MGVLSKKDQEKLEIEKQVKKIMSSQSYKKRMKEYHQQYTMHALVKLTFLTIEYLMVNFKCKKGGAEKYVKFIKARIDEIPDDRKYFKVAEDYYRKELGIDVLQIFGMHLEDEMKNFEGGINQ